MLTNKYRCTQQELYIICDLGWRHCEEYLDIFSGFKSKYTAEYIALQREQVDQAQVMPDLQQRGGVPEGLRIHLRTQAQECTSLWKKLARYIAEAFPESLHKPHMEAAGHGYYREASRERWSSCEMLMTSGSAFIEDHKDLLEANRNMPAGFSTQFSSMRENFSALYLSFLKSEEHARLRREEKLMANNAIYDSLMEMFFDGQILFRHEEAVQRQFIFRQVMRLIRRERHKQEFEV